MARRSAEPAGSPNRLPLAAVLLCAVAAPGLAQQSIVDFRAPDGSRCVLIADPSLPQVHWAIASPADPADDPPGSEGLAFATVVSSLHGTWRTGSLDADKERAALQALDDALLTTHGTASPAAAATLRDRLAEARALGDPRMFARVLAAAPTWQPAVHDHGAFATLVLTTVDTAIADVARLLVERREDQALRELPEAWRAQNRSLAARRGTPSSNAMRAEVLALTMPGHPAARLLEAGPAMAPRRAQAQATWAATQHPGRCVHVLLGNFDAATVQATLTAVFARTTLPPVTAPVRAQPRPLANARRSSVSGVGTSGVAMAWALPPNIDRHLLAAAVRWLADGQGSVLGQELQRSGRPDAVVRGEAPWPPATNGSGLVLIEATDARDARGLADLLLRTCQAAIANPPDAQALQHVAARLHADALLRTPDDRARARELAATVAMWPDSPLTLAVPDAFDGRAVQALLRQVFTGHPAVVEAMP